MVGESKNVVTSPNYEEHLLEILEYSIATFGHIQVSKYFNTISQLVEKLEFDFTCHSECRYLATKSRKYRNIHLDAHLIIYRIATERIEVLDIVHCRSSISKIRSVRKIRL
jgi:plasmid stabilization system protein ParE